MRTSYLVVSAATLIAIIIICLSMTVRVELNSASAETIDALPTAEVTTLDLSATSSPALDETVVATATAELVVPAVQRPAAPTAEPVQKAAATAATAAPAKKATLGTSAQYPERLIIPSINMSVRIVPVGVNDKGEMDVPSGSSNDVGWYKGGPMPGSVGSAVLDAHVFAAFDDLRYVKVGSFVYVQTEGGTKLRFKVVDSRVYTLSELTSDMLFGRHGDSRRLNLITCAGIFVKSIETYDHRLVVYTIYDGEETQ